MSNDTSATACGTSAKRLLRTQRSRTTSARSSANCSRRSRPRSLPPTETTDWEALGATSDEIREFALDGLTRRLTIIGVSLSAI